MTDDQRKAAGRFAAGMRAELRARRVAEQTAEGVTRSLRAAARKACGCGRCA